MTMMMMRSVTKLNNSKDSLYVIAEEEQQKRDEENQEEEEEKEEDRETMEEKGKQQGKRGKKVEGVLAKVKAKRSILKTVGTTSFTMLIIYLIIFLSWWSTVKGFQNSVKIDSQIEGSIFITLSNIGPENDTVPCPVMNADRGKQMNWKQFEMKYGNYIDQWSLRRWTHSCFNQKMPIRRDKVCSQICLLGNLKLCVVSKDKSIILCETDSVQNE